MAARLIQRCSRLLAAPSASFQPPSCSVPVECVRVCHQTQSTPPRTALHTSTLCRHLDSLPMPQQNNGESVDKFHSLVKSAPEVEDLLRISTEHTLNSYMATLVIQEIASRPRDNQKKLINDKRFLELLGIINKQIQTMWNKKLIVLLKSLYVIGLDSTNWYLRSVETEVQWRLRKFSIEALAILSSFLIPFAQSKVQKELVADLLKNVELKCTDIKDTTTLVTLISRLSFMSKSLLERLEDKVLEFAEIFTPEEARKVTAALVVQKQRSVPILRALSFHLVQRNQELSPSVILDLAFAYATLNFHEPQIFQKMACDILPKVPELSPKNVSRCIQSFAKLRFSSLPLCETIAQVCLDHNQSYTINDLVTVVTAFAHLNFQPSQQEEFFSKVHQRLNAELDSLTPQRLVDMVYSLCILQHVTVALIRKVLQPQFYTKILDKEFPKTSSHHLKLIHIQATAQLEVPDYQDPPVTLGVRQPETDAGYRSPMQKDLRTVLKDVFPEDETCNYNRQTVHGWHIDGEFVLDSENKPLILSDLVNPHILHNKGTNPLPEGARRFAVKRWEFSNYSFRTKDLLGRCALCRRQLRAAGFSLVEVPFYEWLELKSQWQKSSFLKEQIQQVAAEETSI